MPAVGGATTHRTQCAADRVDAADLRTRLLEPPPAATRLGADGGFTIGAIPTDLVWRR